MSFRLKVASLDVHAETIAGETIIVHLASGNYYSLRGVGTSIWTLIENEADEAQILDIIARQYNQPRDVIKDDIGGFIAKLQTEALIETAEGQNGSGASLPEPEPAGQAYEAPAIETYSDMQELLLIDPVHEVDNSGWPNTNSDPK